MLFQRHICWKSVMFSVYLLKEHWEPLRQYWFYLRADTACPDKEQVFVTHPHAETLLHQILHLFPVYDLSCKCSLHVCAFSHVWNYITCRLWRHDRSHKPQSQPATDRHHKLQLQVPLYQASVQFNIYSFSVYAFFCHAEAN